MDKYFRNGYTAWTTITEFIKGILNTYAPIFTPIFEGIKNIISNAWNTIKQITSLVWENIKIFLSALLLTLVGLVTGDFALIKQAISNAWNMIKQNT